MDNGLVKSHTFQ